MSSNKTLTENQKKNVVALKKMSSLSIKISQMVEDDSPCYDILQQLKALNGLLRKIQGRIMECSLEQFLESSDSFSSKDKHKKIEEISKSLDLFNK